MGVEQDSLAAVSDRRMLSKVSKIIIHFHFIYNAISLYIVYIYRLSALLFIIYFIVYFSILFYLILLPILAFNISLSLSLVFTHAVFLFLLCTEHWNKNNFPHRD